MMTRKSHALNAMRTLRFQGCARCTCGQRGAALWQCEAVCRGGRRSSSASPLPKSPVSDVYIDSHRLSYLVRVPTHCNSLALAEAPLDAQERRSRRGSRRRRAAAGRFNAGPLLLRRLLEWNGVSSTEASECDCASVQERRPRIHLSLTHSSGAIDSNPRLLFQNLQWRRRDLRVGSR
jgi:hypothetical protein